MSVPTQAPASAHTNISNHDQQTMYAEKLSSHFSSFGPLFKSSSEPIALTESETEYVVTCIKHTFSRHVVFQFDCINTLNDQLLQDVHMVMQPEEDGLIQVAEIAAEKLEYDVTNTIYVAFEQEDPEELGNGTFINNNIPCHFIYFFTLVTFTNTLRFIVKDCDPTTGEADPEGYQDEYQIEDIEVTTSDYIKPCYTSNFEQEFESMIENEIIDTFALDKDKAPSLKGKTHGIKLVF